MMEERKTRWLITFIYNHRMDCFAVYAHNKEEATKFGEDTIFDHFQGAEIVAVKNTFNK